MLLLISLLLCSRQCISEICGKGSWKAVEKVPQDYLGVRFPRNHYTTRVSIMAEACPAETLFHNCYFHDSPRADTLYRRQWVPEGIDCIRYTSDLFLNTIRNRKVVLIGDSVTSQIWKMLVCSLYNPLNSSVHVDWVSYRGGTNEVPFAFNDNTCPVEKFHCVVDNDKPVYAYFSTVNATIHHRYIGKYESGHLKKIFQHENIQPNDIIVVNFGLHYNDDNDYMNALRFFVQDVYQLQTQNLLRRFNDSRDVSKARIFFQETTPQHFAREHEKNGYFNLATAAGWCDPVDLKEIRGMDWRNSLAQYFMKAMVPVIPIAGELYSQYDAHVAGDSNIIPNIQDLADCTHWCAPSGVFQYINTMLLNYLK